MEIIKLLLIGIILGVSNVIPGVSGGTMAVVFGVYDRLLSVITINIKKIFAQWKFWVPLVTGIGLGIIGFSKVITWLFENYPMGTNYFFMGLIVGSIPLIIRKILFIPTKSPTFQGTEKTKIGLSHLLAFIISIGIMIILTIYKGEDITNKVETIFSMSLAIKLIITGFVAAVAMIIPGISGSFFMLVIGMYTTVIAAVSDLNIPLLIPVAIGVILGLLCGASLVRFFMTKVPSQTYSAILGLVIGSVFVIFPGIAISVEMIISVLVFILGFFLAFLSTKGE